MSNVRPRLTPHSTRIMGAFGTGVTQDDTVADVIAFVVDRMKTNVSLVAASAQAFDYFRELEGDEDESPLLWMAVAAVQWKFGALDDTVLRRVRTDITKERGLDRWREDPKLLAKRKFALETFLAKIETPNPRPSSPPRLITRKAPFREGDCLSVKASDGRYTAALVLRADDSRPEYGKNLIAGLDYLGTDPPSPLLFERREWLFKHHGQWNGAPDLAWFQAVGFQRERERFAVVANIALRSADPKESGSYAGWNLLGQQILLCRAASTRAEV